MEVDEKNDLKEGDKDENSDLAPRDYQSQLLDIALKQNTILFLPTGSGKTYVAVMLIKSLSADLFLPLNSGGKRSFFMVNTVALVNQQAEYIRRHADVTVGQYSGDMGVDFWSPDVWLQELQEHQVIVMTCQIFLDILLHNIISLEAVNLIIFDECHHAVSDHNMAQVMQLFETVPLERQPRVLGLTATLLNSNCKPSNVISQVEKLEITYRSKIATIDDPSKVHGFCTNPIEKIHFYEAPSTLPVVHQVKLIIDRSVKDAMSMTFDDDIDTKSGPENSRALKAKNKTNKKIKNVFLDLSEHIDMLGIYGGSLSAAKHGIQLERVRKKAEDFKTKCMYLTFITTLNMIRKLLEDHMSDCTKKSRLYKYSSPKVLSLFEVLEDMKTMHSGTETRGIIFVDRRFTAKVIYLILKDLQSQDEKFSFLKPEFVVGFQSNPFNSTRESALDKKWNQEAIYRFIKGHRNVIVSSDVLEEGIDIPQCNLVIRFDEPKSYRSYIQSKGRARMQSSEFILLVPAEKASICYKTYNSYKAIEENLKKLLVGQNENRSWPTEDVEDNDEEGQNEVYFTNSVGSSRVTLNSAIALVNRYCSMLPQDKFTSLIPSWYIKTSKTSFQCFLELPINSALKNTFVGKEMGSNKKAKRSVALVTCEALHKAGELNDFLLPLGSQAELIDSQELFPVYESEELEPDSPRPGSKKFKRHYKKKYPSALTGCRPLPYEMTYLHVIHMKPVYPRPAEEDARKLAFYDLLASRQNFAILTGRELPPICQFPIFMNVGEVQVNVACSVEQLNFNAEELERLQRFNTVVFFDVMKLCKLFMIVDLENEENSYFIVPIKCGDEGKDEIDWDVVDSHPRVPKRMQMSDEDRQHLKVTQQDYHMSVVTPWYRGQMPEQMYVVTKVCEGMTPLSQFPTKDYDSFKEYFDAKYNLNILNPKQPMLEVKAISNKINCLRPRGVTMHGTSKRKRQELQDDFEEHLVPELCTKYSFPTVLWLKATCLPSVLHRVHYLLLAEELRQKIACDLNFPISDDVVWEPLQVDPECFVEKTAKSSTTMNPTTNGVMVAATASKLVEKALWEDDNEPLDIDRECLEDLTLMDIQYYYDFISKSMKRNVTGTVEFGDILSETDLANTDAGISPRRNIPINRSVCPINILETEVKGVGPQQYHILQALTNASANDVFNLERLETLGDSFLKFATSFFLYMYYPNVNEGSLTQIKGKMVGNRNLYYCGKARDLGQMMKVQEFTPLSDWCPPSFCVMRKLQQVLRDIEASPTVLYELRIPEEEQLLGIVGPDTQQHIEETVLEYDHNANIHSSMESFIGLQSVVDKSMADCVEAIIGAYLKAYGINGAFLMLGWLRILPPEKAIPDDLFDSPVCTAFLAPDIGLLPDIEFHLGDTTGLENRLDYHFKDRSFLLQALSHASYVQNRLTDCYQRLEFLGDAILDFLITCHIYETCGNLCPGDLTDLRSALVNNVTFATLSVRYGFHKYYKFNSSKLFDKVDSFVAFQEERKHAVNEDVLTLLEEDDCMAESVDVPKVLGDLFESLAGAIYLDSGKSLNEVWRVYYALMKKEIIQFSKNIPKQAVRMLYEKCQPSPVFHKTVVMEGTERVMVQVDIVVGGEKRKYYGFGENKFHAKRAAAKLALKDVL